MKLLQKSQLPSNNLATKLDVVRLFNYCFDKKIEAFNKKSNSLHYIAVAIICAILTVVIEFFPAIMLQNWFGKVFGGVSLSVLITMILKSSMKGALARTNIITKIIKKLINQFLMLFMVKNKKHNSMQRDLK